MPAVAFEDRCLRALLIHKGTKLDGNVLPSWKSLRALLIHKGTKLNVSNEINTTV